MEERYVTGQIKAELYGKFIGKYKDEAAEIDRQLKESAFDSSNLNSIVEKGFAIAENLSQLWVLSDFSHKQKLQYLVFSEGILYSKQNDQVRTGKANDLFAEIPPLVRVSADKEKGNLNEDCLLSHSVPEIGNPACRQAGNRYTVAGGKPACWQAGFESVSTNSAKVIICSIVA